MKILYFATSDNEVSEKLLKTIQSFVPKKRIEIYRTVRSLRNRLQLPPTYEFGVSILFAFNEKELMDLYKIRGFLEDIRFILITDTKINALNSLGRTLKPRILLDADIEPKILKAVLMKMIGFYEIQIV
jgi:hypothetical protein